MKILFAISSLAGGGAERVTAGLANYWAKRGEDVTILTFAAKDEDFYVLNPSVKRISLEIKASGGRMFGFLTDNLKKIRTLSGILKKLSPEICISMIDTTNVIAALSSRLAKGPVFIGCEQIYPPRFPLNFAWEKLRKYSYKWLDCLVCMTSESRTWLERNTNVKKLAVIPNFVDYPLVDNKPRLEISGRVPPDRRILLSVGRLAPQKGFDILIDAFAGICPSFPDWDLIIAGEGTQRDELEKMVKERHLENRVILPGIAGNIADWYKRADLFVMSSRFEGFPNALLEAMAYGCPSISFDCETGPRGIIHDGEDGELVTVLDSGKLAETMKKLMLDENLRKKYAAKAVSVRENFSVKKITEDWETLFKNTASRI